MVPHAIDNVQLRVLLCAPTTQDDSGDSALELQIETRFPMFGGWQTQFYLGNRVYLRLSVCM